MMPRIVCVPPPPAVGVLPAAGTHQTFARKAAESAPHCAVRWYGDRIDVVNPERKLGRVERSWLMPKQRQHFGFDSAPRPHFARLRERLSVVAICLFWTDCNALPWGRSALARRPRLGLGFRPDCHFPSKRCPPGGGKARDLENVRCARLGLCDSDANPRVGPPSMPATWWRHSLTIFKSGAVIVCLGLPRVED